MAERTQTDNNILLDVKGLKKYFPIQAGLMRRTVGYVKAVDDISLYVREGETLGLVALPGLHAGEVRPDYAIVDAGGKEPLGQMSSL